MERVPAKNPIPSTYLGQTEAANRYSAPVQSSVDTLETNENKTFIESLIDKFYDFLLSIWNFIRQQFLPFLINPENEQLEPLRTELESFFSLMTFTDPEKNISSEPAQIKKALDAMNPALQEKLKPYLLAELSKGKKEEVTEVDLRDAVDIYLDQFKVAARFCLRDLDEKLGITIS